MEYALDRFVMTDNKMLVVQGANSLYTYQHVSGSSVAIQGSNNAVDWVDIGELTPNATFIKEHSYKYLKSVGAGTVLVNRGEGNNTNDSSDSGDLADTLLLLDSKQDKLPTTGTAGQFLAHDMTFKTPVTWVRATDACSYIHPSILASAVNLYFAKINGFLAMRGQLYSSGIINAGERLFKMNAAFCILQWQPNDASNSSEFGGKYGYRNAMVLGNRFEIYPNIASGAPDQTALFTNMKLYGYYDPIYVSDPCLGMLVNP